ncbi:MAG: hypothetical protein EOP04_05800 [Proteobacteria bacterium]|nr:MAG: hypothetical protein EOP04_05800 [Pseudomonadota bacterium]
MLRRTRKRLYRAVITAPIGGFYTFLEKLGDLLFNPFDRRPVDPSTRRPVDPSTRQPSLKSLRTTTTTASVSSRQ